MSIALVLDGEQRAALAVVRSLARRGLRVETASAAALPLASVSRGVGATHRYPAPQESASNFLAWLHRSAPATVLPVTDATTMLVRSLSATSDEGYEPLSDKTSLLSLAAKHGVPVPRGVVARSIREAIGAGADLGYPVVLKPARSRLLLRDHVVATSVRMARNAAEIERVLVDAQWFPHAPVIMQEFIAGRGAGVFCLYDRDHALAWFAHKRLRERPSSGGVSVLCESVPVDPILQGYAETLLRGAGYRGVAMVEFRIGPDGRPYLMEVNARFWGSLQLAIDCGVDFPWLHWQLLHGHPGLPVKEYAVGRRMRWLLGDLDSLLLQWRSPIEPTTKKAAATARFIRTAFDLRCRQEVMRWTDPSPGFREMRLWLSDLLGSDR